MLARHLYEFGYAIRGSTYHGKLSSTPSRNEVPVYHMEGGGRDAFIARTLLPRRPAHATVGLDADARAREPLDVGFQIALRPAPRPATFLTTRGELWRRTITRGELSCTNDKDGTSNVHSTASTICCRNGQR